MKRARTMAYATPARAVTWRSILAMFFIAVGVAMLIFAAGMAHAQTPGSVALPAPGSQRAAMVANGRIERLEVADPYLELHTGSGRGFPVFHVAERGTWVTVELRHTDWYRVRTDAGQLGWVHRSQLERTLTASGARKSYRDLLLDDYLARRVEVGAAWGRFRSEPMLKSWAAYRFSDTIAMEATLGQVQGLFSGTDYTHLNLQFEPWSDRRLSPYMGIGFGQFRNLPNSSLVSATATNAKLANAVIGARWHLSQRFMVRVDYTLHTAFLDDTRNGEYRAVSAGLSFFF